MTRDLTDLELDWVSGGKGATVGHGNDAVVFPGGGFAKAESTFVQTPSGNVNIQATSIAHTTTDVLG